MQEEKAFMPNSEEWLDPESRLKLLKEKSLNVGSYGLSEVRVDGLVELPALWDQAKVHELAEVCAGRLFGAGFGGS